MKEINLNPQVLKFITSFDVIGPIWKKTNKESRKIRTYTIKQKKEKQTQTKALSMKLTTERE